MNKIILMGRLPRDPEIRYTNQGTRQMAVARYTLAVDRRVSSQAKQGEQTADFISCVAFDKSAEFAEKWLHQGMKMLVTGRLQTGSYTNREGQKVYTADVVIESQEFCEKRSEGESYVPHPAMTEAQKNTPPSQYQGGWMNAPDSVDDDSLPFN